VRRDPCLEMNSKMKNSKKSRSLLAKLAVSVLIVAYAVTLYANPAQAVEAPLSMGSASTYGVLSSAAVTSATTSGITGSAGSDIGVASATAPTGVINTSGATILGGSAITALTAASGALSDNRGGTVTGVELGGTIKTPGAYNNPTLGITGTLTLDGLGDASSIFIFRSGSTLVTAASSSVILTNGAQACNVYWQVGSSATLGASSTIVGHVIASASISTGTSSFVNGQLIATTAAVTLGGTTIVNNSCAAPVVTPIPVATVVPTPVVTPTPVATVVPTPVVTPTPVATVVPTPVVTPTPAVTPVVTPTPVATPVVTPTPVATPTESETPAPVTTTESGGELPKTALPWGNILLLGAGLTLFGSLGLTSQKNKTKK
jgi:hypothetical protein